MGLHGLLSSANQAESVQSSDELAGRMPSREGAHIDLRGANEGRYATPHGWCSGHLVRNRPGSGVVAFFLGQGVVLIVLFYSELGVACPDCVNSRQRRSLLVLCVDVSRGPTRIRGLKRGRDGTTQPLNE